MNNSDLPYWLAVNSFLGIGPLRFKVLLDYFGSAEKIWMAEERELLKINLGQKLTERFLRYRQTFDIPSYLFRMEESGVFALTWEDKSYPKKLKEIDSSPPIIYVLSDKYKDSGQARVTMTDGMTEQARMTKLVNINKLFQKKTIAVVGTRKITVYGRQVTEMLTADLVTAGLVIASGLMYGVDEVAHRMAIKSGGETIGVWAGGVDTVFTGSRKNLAEMVVKHGAVISEFPMGMNPSRGTFPARNRIVSGLSLGVLVTEGAEDSGSLITASNAAQQGREVFAVPGPITSPLSMASSSLIKKGAKLVSSSEDILEELGVKKDTKIQGYKDIKKDLTGEEKKIWELLENEGMHIDEIVRKTGLTSSQVGTLLSLMEIRGLVENLGGGVYGRKI